MTKQNNFSEYVFSLCNKQAVCMNKNGEIRTKALLSNMPRSIKFDKQSISERTN